MARHGAVIVAAGMSTRMGDFKQLMKIGDMTLVERVVVNFQRAGIKDIVVVTGYQAERVEKTLHHFGVTFLKNEDYKTTQMMDSAKIGLAYLRDRCDQVFFCPVDVPLFKEKTVRSMREQEGQVVYPVCQEHLGHPVRIGSSLIPSILAYLGDNGLKGALDSLRTDRVYLPVKDEGILIDVDTQEDYQHLLELHNTELMRPQIKVRLTGQKPFFGPGMVTLLREINSTESVREACAKTGISYSKAWTMIHTAEDELGYKVVERQPGGRNGGAAYVTQKGKKLLRLFIEYEARMEDAARQIYQDIFFDSDLF